MEVSNLQFLITNLSQPLACKQAIVRCDTSNGQAAREEWASVASWRVALHENERLSLED